MFGNKHLLILATLALLLALLGVGCQAEPNVVEVEKVVTQVVEVEKEVTKIVAGTPVVETIVETTEVEVVVTATPEPVVEKPNSEKTIIILLSLKYHPVHQMAATAFLRGCEEVGYNCEVIGADNDMELLVSMAEQAITREDVVAIVPWTGRPAIYPVVEEAANKGILVVWPHYGVMNVAGVSAIVGADSAQYSAAAAEKMCEALGDQEGSIAVTLATFSDLETSVAMGFTKKMAEVCPQVTVLDPAEEGMDPPQAVAKAIAIMLANPDIIGAFSTTGGGASTWANAQKETGRQIVAMGMDYTEVNLDLVKKGEVFAVVGQPIWEEDYEAPLIVDKLLKGESVPYWTKLDAPIVTAENVDQFLGYVENVQEAIQQGLLPSQ
ncbi:MAG: sugar ABC transporter substrate-binding protein [Anaerolineales bacterium]|nr:sugar ABC transporter substrate-binding protein [Anaerolineales bacterium]